MPALQVRDLPEPIYRKLHINARNENRSLSQQAIVTLKKGLDMNEDLKDRRRKLVERILNKSIDNDGKHLDSPVKLIRKDRAR